jgi:peptidylprolyl isomerase
MSYKFASYVSKASFAVTAALTLACGAVYGEDKSSNEFSGEEVKKVSEAYGHFVGKNLNPPGFKFDLDSFLQGVRNGVDGKPSPMTEQEFEATIAKIQEQSVAKQGQENLEKANAFMEKNGKESGVVVLEPNKLQYQILSPGTGEAVVEGGTPLVNYTLKFIDGSVFASTDELGGAIPIPLTQVFPGFSKGVPGMKEGEKRRLFVHPDLAYGTNGPLPPNSLLIFDIEVVKAQAPKDADLDDELDDEAEDAKADSKAAK